MVEHTLIPALRRQGQADLCEFEASLVYRASSWIGSKATQKNPVSKNKKQNKKEQSKFQDSQSCNIEKPCLEKQIYKIRMCTHAHLLFGIISL